jgi:hypothetical protein
MIVKWLALLTLTIIVSFTAHSQTPTEVRLDPQQPTIYFTAERLVGNNLWLRLHNNSRWAIDFYAERPVEINIPYRLADGSEVKSLVEGAELSPQYDIENPNGGYAVYSCVKYKLWLTPGTSVLMSVPVEKLKPLAYFWVKFTYEWEGEGEQPEHRVRFRYYPETKVPVAN